MEFGMSKKFGPDNDFDAIESKVRELLAEEGFGILTEVDVKAVMMKKLDLVKRPYKILGACNPPRANKVLEADPQMGIFLPCNVVVYQEEDGSTMVTATNAYGMFKMIGNEEIEPVANEVTEIFARVLDKLETSFS